MIYVNVSVVFIGNTIYLVSSARNVLMGEASQKAQVHVEC